MYNQCSFGWSFEMMKTFLLNLTFLAFPHTMLQIEAGTTYSSFSPAHGVLFQNRSLLKKVTDHTAHFELSKEKPFRSFWYCLKWQFFLNFTFLNENKMYIADFCANNAAQQQFVFL